MPAGPPDGRCLEGRSSLRLRQPVHPLAGNGQLRTPYFTHLFPKNRTRVGFTECGGSGPLSPFRFLSILLPSLAPLFRRSFSPQNSSNRSVTIREHLPQSSLP